MILYLSNGKQIRGDLIKQAVFRSDMAPIPVTLEAEIRVDDGMKSLLSDGGTVLAGSEQVPLLIIKSQFNAGRIAQGERAVATMRILASLEAVHPVAFVRRTAIIKENATLSSIYRAAGAKLRTIDADFPVPRFVCPVGDTPSFQIARVLQEEGGIVRWKSGKMAFIRLPDLFKQKAVANIPSNENDKTESGFLERHSIPWFYSLNAAGGFVHGNREKARAVRFSPFKNAQQVRNMSRCLVHERIAKIDYSGALCAGDAVSVADGSKLVIVTAAHVYESGTDGATPGQYSRLWLSSVEE